LKTVIQKNIRDQEVKEQGGNNRTIMLKKVIGEGLETGQKSQKGQLYFSALSGGEN